MTILHLWSWIWVQQSHGNSCCWDQYHFFWSGHFIPAWANDVSLCIAQTLFEWQHSCQGACWAPTSIRVIRSAHHSATTNEPKFPSALNLNAQFFQKLVYSFWNEFYLVKGSFTDSKVCIVKQKVAWLLKLGIFYNTQCSSSIFNKALGKFPFSCIF